MEQAEGAAFSPRTSDSLHNLACLAIQLPHRGGGDIRDKDVVLLRIGREVHRPCGATDFGVPGDIEFLLELALLGEHLDAIAGAIADIDESVFGNADGMDRGLEVLGARLALLAYIRLTVIADFAQRLAVGAP